MTLADDVFRGVTLADVDVVRDDVDEDGDGDLDDIGDDRNRFEVDKGVERNAGGEDVGGVGGLTSFNFIVVSLDYLNN
jgi:hypothetical protein